jgi:hypothetical protein
MPPDMPTTARVNPTFPISSRRNPTSILSTSAQSRSSSPTEDPLHFSPGYFVTLIRQQGRSHSNGVKVAQVNPAVNHGFLE